MKGAGAEGPSPSLRQTVRPQASRMALASIASSPRLSNRARRIVARMITAGDRQRLLDDAAAAAAGNPATPARRLRAAPLRCCPEPGSASA